MNSFLFMIQNCSKRVTANGKGVERFFSLLLIFFWSENWTRSMLNTVANLLCACNTSTFIPPSSAFRFPWLNFKLLFVMIYISGLSGSSQRDNINGRKRKITQMCVIYIRWLSYKSCVSSLQQARIIRHSKKAAYNSCNKVIKTAFSFILLLTLFLTHVPCHTNAQSELPSRSQWTNMHTLRWRNYIWAFRNTHATHSFKKRQKKKKSERERIYPSYAKQRKREKMLKNSTTHILHWNKNSRVCVNDELVLLCMLFCVCVSVRRGEWHRKPFTSFFIFFSFSSRALFCEHCFFAEQWQCQHSK